MDRHHPERHLLSQIGWLRPAVLGANDGIVSTSSLILGVAAADVSHGSILLTGLAGLVAGAMSMATGEYVSVQSQADTEQAALKTERAELRDDPDGECRELTRIYVRRGLTPELAAQVAQQLTAHDALGAHARDELGITEAMAARPLLAAVASALSFSTGALLPLLVVICAPEGHLQPLVAFASLCFLALLGGLAAKVGGASVPKGVLRVTFWSALSMTVSTAVGTLFGA